MKHMTKSVLSLFFLLLLFPLSAQEYRSIDGRDNNLGNPDWGTAHGPIVNMTSPSFSDGYQAPAGLTRPNPRHISNLLFRQNGEFMPDPMSLSDYTWVFGQFIDHDITLIHENFEEPLPVRVPPGDAQFDPYGSGNAIIPMVRNVVREGTGTGPGNPRQYDNAITAFIDGSAVYGSDAERAAWLRSFTDGKLKVSAGNLLPFNTTNNEYTGEIDPFAPFMANMNRATTRFFVAGDDRANENMLLASMHTLWVREHNRLCDSLVQAHPDWNDERLYQHARKLVGGMLQAITYNEWLPVMGIDLPAYEGYRTDVNPAITNVFSAAAFRFGHTLLNSTLLRVGSDGSTIPEGNISLRDAFFQPTEILLGRGIDPLFKGMSYQVMQTYDCRLVEDVRSFLFGRPGQGGLDLAAINIMRGRERGLPDFNTIRTELGLPLKEKWSDIAASAEDVQTMESLYGTVYNIDPWVGMLAEARMPNSFIGETAMEIVKRQFLNLRDGDRFFYENDPHLSAVEQAMIRNTTLSKVILRNTSITHLPDNTFRVEDVTTSVFQRTQPEPGAELHVAPNPAKVHLMLEIAMARSEQVSINILDLSGRLLETSRHQLTNGLNFVNYELQEDDGIYVIQLTTTTGTVSKRVVKL